MSHRLFTYFLILICFSLYNPVSASWSSSSGDDEEIGFQFAPPNYEGLFEEEEEEEDALEAPLEMEEEEILAITNDELRQYEIMGGKAAGINLEEFSRGIRLQKAAERTQKRERFKIEQNEAYEASVMADQKKDRLEEEAEQKRLKLLTQEKDEVFKDFIDAKAELVRMQLLSFPNRRAEELQVKRISDLRDELATLQ